MLIFNKNIVYLFYFIQKALDRDIKLMEAYRQMPILYDRDHPDFRYVNKKEKAWKELR